MGFRQDFNRQSDLKPDDHFLSRLRDGANFACHIVHEMMG